MSANFTHQAETSNAENLLVIHSEDLAAKYMANWETHKFHSEVYSGREESSQGRSGRDGRPSKNGATPKRRAGIMLSEVVGPERHGGRSLQGTRRAFRTGHSVQGIPYRAFRTGHSVQGIPYRAFRTGHSVQGNRRIVTLTVDELNHASNPIGAVSQVPAPLEYCTQVMVISMNFT